MKAKTSILAVFVLSLLTFGAFADDHGKILKDNFEFSRDVLVGSTQVKKGKYQVKYNTQTGVVSIFEGSKVVASAKATMKVNDKDFDKDEILTTETAGNVVLTGLRLGGQREELMLVT